MSEANHEGHEATANRHEGHEEDLKNWRNGVGLVDEGTEMSAHRVVDAALRVHRMLGPGLLEGAYEACLAHQLRQMGSEIRQQVVLPVAFDGVDVPLGYRVDLIVDDVVIVELKAVTKLLPIHEAQLLSYLRLSGRRIGLLINFHAPLLKHGIRRMINGY